MRIFRAIVFATIILSVSTVFADSHKRVIVNNIEFEDVFERLKQINVVNTSSAAIQIDSLVYSTDRYYIRTNSGTGIPAAIPAYDTLKLDCILRSSALISSVDVMDSLLIYSSASTQAIKVNIKIDFFDDDAGYGRLTGKISSTSTALAGVKLLFFYDGKYLIDSAKTNSYGVYSVSLPQGNYIVGANLSGYFLTFSGNATDFLKAVPVKVAKDSISSADITLATSPSTAVSISGTVKDALTNSTLKKGIVIIHHGTHTPGSLNKVSAMDTLSFTGLIASDGTYKVDNLPADSYYRVQVFSDFYLPGYFTNSGKPAVLWQESDSIAITGALVEKNVSLESDLSYGAGEASGSLGALMKVSGNNSSVNALVLAHSLTNGEYYSYGVSDASGGFTVKELPFGTYELVAQRLNQADLVSSPFVIDNTNKAYRSVFLQPLSAKKEKNNAPSGYLLLNNYPNPFNPSTSISYSLPEAGAITINVYSLVGQKVETLYSGEQTSGQHQINFSATGLSSGSYFVVLRTIKESIVRKILLMK